MNSTVLVIEDDPHSRELILLYLEEEPFEVITAKDGFEAMEILKGNTPIDIVVSDVRLPGISGGELVTYIHSLHPNIPVIIITGYASIEGAVSFLRQGAFDYITKPFTRSTFTHRLYLAAKHAALSQEVDKLRAEQPQASTLDNILGSSPAIVKIISMLPSVAKTNASVLIQGESGTGKELIAKAIHELSRRSNKAFITVNCAALPEQLLESELFGYKRGAFTDAQRDKRGLADEAHGGSLFMDEIGDMPLTVQVKFLRLLQEKTYKPLGSNETRHADIRFIAATNRRLEEMITVGTFRDDLYYRLNIIPITLPPLRQRKNDIPIMVMHFLKRFADEHQRSIRRVDDPVMQRFMEYSWPGNIRELMNTLQRLVVMNSGENISMPALQHTALAKKPEPTEDTPGIFKVEKQKVVDHFEHTYLIQCIERAAGNISQAAKTAGMDRKSFWRLMQKHHITQAP